MFYHIAGTVAELDSYLAVIDCSGVGYALNVSANTLSRLRPGERAKLYVSEIVKEDAFDLYGFYTKAEKRSFELLIGVSGVGPKAALSILSSSTPENLAMAILAGDEKALTVAPGIGKKIAQHSRALRQDGEGDGLAFPARAERPRRRGRGRGQALRRRGGPRRARLRRRGD